MQRKDHISGNLAEKQEIVFMLASGRQTVPGQAKKSARATFLSENVLKHLNQSVSLYWLCIFCHVVAAFLMW